MAKKEIDVDGVKVEFDPDARYRMTIAFERIPDPSDPSDSGRDKGSYTTGDLDYGTFVGVQGLVVDMLNEMKEWGDQMADAVGVIVPGREKG